MVYSNVNSGRITTPYFRNQTSTIESQKFFSPPVLPHEKTIVLTDTLSSTLDGPPVIIFANTIIVPKGKTVTVSKRCCGLFLIALSRIEIYGTVSMSKRGAWTPKPYNLQIDLLKMLHGYGPDITYTPLFRKIRINNENHHHVEFVGNDFNVASGGKGGRSSRDDTLGGGPGAVGSIFSGGAGGSGSVRAEDLINTPAQPYGGRGGETSFASGWNASGSPGAGNPGGMRKPQYSGWGTDGESGTGGSIFLISFGDIILHANSILSATGAKGGEGVPPKTGGVEGRGGGGGSGGGLIEIVFTNNFSNKASIDLSGGDGGGPVGGTYGGSTMTVAQPGETGKLKIIKLGDRGTL